MPGPKRPPDPEAPTPTVVIARDEVPSAAAAEEQRAPRTGVQIRIPDQETAAPPPRKRAVVAPPVDDGGRRGAWWNEKAPPVPDEPLHDGNTLPVEPAPPPPPPPRRVEPPPEPEVEPYRPVPAPDYAGHVRRGPPRWKVRLVRAAIACGVVALLGALALVGGYFYVASEVPTFDSVRDYHPKMSTRVLADDGTVVGQFYQERRTVVPMDRIPRVLVQAVISAEDKDFYKHSGVNAFALLRAAVVDALSGQKRLGASTITQQVVKNFFLSNEKRWKRKLKEILLAERLEKNLSKDDILYLYLNQINFGKAHYGVEEAALYYFGKHVQDVDLGEAAMLAGLPQNPARINPRRHPERAKKRQIYVLDRMLANHYITPEEHDREVDRPIQLAPIPKDPPGGWYLEEVRRQLVAQFGEGAVETAGMTVETAMDPKLQAAAEAALQDGLRAIDKREGYRGPALKIDPSRLDESQAALARRYAQLAQDGEHLPVFDLDGLGEKDARSADALARAARVRDLEQDGIYSGIVTQVSAREARVQLAPGVEAAVPLSSMTWAREFKPEHATPAPRSARDVLAPGDVASVRVLRFSATRDAPGHLKVTRLELQLEQTPLVQGAFVALDLRTRQVLALVGGYDDAASAFNRATQARRQPGSAIKPFLYAAALESGRYTPTTRIDDSPEVIVDPWTGKPWKPENFEKDEFAGSIPLRRALAESKNTVAVKLLVALGLDKLRNEAMEAGLVSDIPQSFTAALGTGEVGVMELINAYATIAGQGRRADPILVRRVLSRDGNTMQTAQLDPQPGIRPDVAYLTADLMRSVIDDPEGTAHSLSVLGRPAAGKTGTTSEHRDAWFIGFTPSVLAGAWVGFDDHRMMGSYETGGHAAGPIWLSWMRAATANAPVEEWPEPPPGVTCVRVNRTSGALASDNDPFAVRECFLAGTEPTQRHVDHEPTADELYQQK